jgi:hypothetical protein
VGEWREKNPLNGHHFFSMGRKRRENAEDRRTDKDQIEAKLGDFDPKKSQHVADFMEFLGRPRHRVIVEIVSIIANKSGLPALSRVEKKSKELVLKWVHEHWEVVRPKLRDFHLFANDGTRVSKDPGSPEL